MTLPRYKELAVKVVLRDVKSNKTIMKYIPEVEDFENPDVDKLFLFTIVNTVDPDYFINQLDEIEKLREKEALKKQEDTIAVRPEIMALLTSFGRNHLGKCSKASSVRALAALKVNAKKRRRRASSKKQAANLSAETLSQVGNPFVKAKRMKTGCEPTK